MTKDREKLDGVAFFLDVIDTEIREVVKEQPTKMDMTSYMQVWLNHINTIKGIIQ